MMPISYANEVNPLVPVRWAVCLIRFGAVYRARTCGYHIQGKLFSQKGETLYYVFRTHCFNNHIMLRIYSMLSTGIEHAILLLGISRIFHWSFFLKQTHIKATYIDTLCIAVGVSTLFGFHSHLARKYRLTLYQLESI